MSNFVIHSEAEQGTPEWLEARNAGIGSTDSSSILGVNPYKTPKEVYLEKIGEGSKFEGNWFTERGKALEPVLRQHFSDAFGKDVLNVPGTLRHPDYDFILASLDGYTEDGELTEFKTATTRKGWGEAGSDEIPAMYLVQVQHAMLVTGTEVTQVGVSFGGLEPEYYTPLDRDWETKMKS